MNKTLLASAILLATVLGNTGVVEAKTRWDNSQQALQDAINSFKSDLLLRALLKEMPKGGDLHSHLSGAITMERLIEWGAADGVCVNTTTYIASPPPCVAGQTALSNALTDTNLYNKVLGAWSMEGAPNTLLGAHQHFFDSFGKFGAVLTDDRTDDSIADVLSTAGKNNQVYVELMQGFSSSTIGRIAKNYILPTDPWDAAYLLKKRKEIISDPLFNSTLQNAKLNLKKSLDGARQLLGCGTANPDPGCNVEPRFLLSANRTNDRGYVFAQWVYAYELAQTTPEVLGVNLVSPEEHPNSLLYYNDEMLALNVLRRFNEKTPKRRPVHISLHAGELIPSVLPATPEGQQHLTFHITNAVKIAHAERIGHGVDLLDEVAGAGVRDLLKTMQRQNVAVEVCLTSNASLLGKQGKTHPVRTYLNYGVPVVLSTDDQGIFRIDITDEFVRAVTEQGFPYITLKDLVRASLEHSFLPGKSLWQNKNRYDTVAAACKNDLPSAIKPSASCGKLLASSERAALQWKLEAQFNEFEDNAVQIIRALNNQQ